MGFTDKIKEAGYLIQAALSPSIRKERDDILEVADDLRIRANQLENDLEIVKEMSTELELQLEDMGWRETRGLGNRAWNPNRIQIRKMMDLSRKVYITNPLMRRSVEVQALYVWALGFTTVSKDPNVQKVVDQFFKDPKNMAALDWENLEREQQITGNNFLALFHNPDTGAARARMLPVDQIIEVISNPDDSKEPWFYKREFLDDKGKVQYLLYADCNYYTSDLPGTYKGILVEQDCCVFHIKTGGLMDQQFGMPEYYSVISWCIAYKDTLSNWATILEAYARMAFKMTGLSGKKKVAAAKDKLGTTVNANGDPREKNPPNNVAGWFLASGGVDISAVRTAGATTSATEAKPLLDMVAAGAGLPSHFYGNSDQGNFATSETLDRPTELKFVSRQKLWMKVMLAIIQKLIEWSAAAGTLEEATVKVSEDPFDGSIKLIVTIGGKEPFVEVSFPSILERNVTERVRAIVAAATLNGSKAEGIIPNRKFLCGQILQAMSVPYWEKVLEELYPKDVLQGFVDPVDELEVQKTKAQGAADLGTAALDQADNQAKALAKPKPAGAPAVSNK